MASMDYIFTVTDQATGTVTLTSSPYSYYSGGVLTGDRQDRTVVDTLEVRLKDTTSAANLDELRTLNRLLQQAEDAQTDRTLDRVYITWQETSGGTVWRSEIVSGRTEPRTDALQLAYWSNDVTFAPVYIERANYWEGPETSATVSNMHGTAAAGVTVYDMDDSTHDNWVSIAANQVAGDLPTPAILELTNAGTAASNYLFYLWAGLNYHDPANFTPTLEAEAGGGGAAALTGYSGGTVSTGTATAAAFATMWEWTLGTALLNAAGGGWFHAILRTTNDTYMNVTQWKLRIKYGASTLAEYGPVTPRTGPEHHFDLFAIQLPPWLFGGTNSAELTMTMLAKSTDGSDREITADYLLLMPADSLRYYYANGYAIQEDSRIIDNPVDDWLYSDAGDGTTRVGNYIAIGDPIMLRPNKLQRIYFAIDASVAADPPYARMLSVVVKYRPRRLSL